MGDAVKPAWRSCPDYQLTLGPVVSDLCARAGFAPDPEQEQCLDEIFAIDPENRDRRGKFRSLLFEYAVIAPRQNLKTGLAKQAELGWLFVTEQRLITHSAHEVPTSTSTFNDLVNLIEGRPWLSKMLPAKEPHGIYRSPGRERIELKDGRKIQFRARTRSGGRGLTGDKMVLDEAFALLPEHMGALLPTLAVVPDPQLLYLSSAGLLTSEQLRDIRTRGRAGAPRIGYREWGAPWTPCADPECSHAKPGSEFWKPGCQLDNVENWRLANPQIGKRLLMDTMIGFRKSMPPHEFAREFLSWWDDPGADAVFGPGAWDYAATEYPDPMDFKPEAIGAAVAIDQKSSAIVGCGYRMVGDHRVPAVKVLAAGPGEGWLIETAARYGSDLKAPVVMAKDGPGSHLVEPMRKACRGRFKTPTFPQYLDSCAELYVAVSSGNFQHGDQAELNDAVANAEKLEKGDRWVWRRRGAVDISPLEACTLALWGASHWQRSAADERMQGGGPAVMSV